ncbi:RecQ family ATP-dependent DNA helicase [Exiguobacterium sp. SH0S7]|uniref:RecQ family ATP-dependent DNA helicase n=1 Tax=Exiguobacterium sp. SH0S7 TaxID=2510951 RepID=UPI00103BF5DE|nr:RecQ family ATP-dependent DNA helicase [Exiguobacterium sp. SH0S7]TCI73374.1 RecQ family ATP-dependent DNA helicase [Exiguobacterium sp. SH0S7]
MSDLITELTEVFGDRATFRDEYQELAVQKVVNKERVLIVQKTGWGKSLVYFLATKILRQRGDGVTIIISPLLSLARNQIESTAKYNITAESINSQQNKTQVERIEVIERCNNGQCDVLFITPEQLQKEEFIRLLSQLRIALFVVDEAHCISDWGHDFRPDYRRIRQLLDILPNNVGVLATTATANDRVIQDISNQLGNCEIIRGPLQRNSLKLHKVHLPTTELKYSWISKNINFFPGSGIIYATTIKECERLAQWLQTNQIAAYPYHSNLSEEVKVELEEKLINNELKVLVSTIALGMGFDKDDISFVIHYYTPKSMIEYYQQIGRAGRNISDSHCILLYGGKEETRINEYFIYNSFPKQEDIDKVLSYLDTCNQAKMRDLSDSINIKSSVLEQILKLLSIEGIIAKDGSNYYRTVKPYISQESYYESIIQMKIKEYSELLAYQNQNGCLMQFITESLDDPFSEPCGQCSNCANLWVHTDDTVSTLENNKVQDFFDNQFILIEPRKLSGIPGLRKLAYVFETGIALSYYHEELGQEARRGKYINGAFSNILIEASAKKIITYFYKNKLNWNDVVIVPIPSNRRPLLVPQFAQKLAEALKCEYAHVLAKRPDEPEQKSFLNSQHQEANIRNYLFIDSQIDLSNKHILLVDDFVDSKWTFAIGAELIATSYNNVKVTPFAISDTSDSD